MDSLENISHKSPFGSVSHLANMGSWKAGSHTSKPTVAKSSIPTHFESRHCKWEKNTFQYSVTNLGDHNSRTKPMIFCIWHKSGIFDKGMGSFASIKQAYCRAGERTAALRNLLLAGSGCLEFPKRMVGIDVLVLNEHVDQISFGTAPHFANMGSWKAGSPTSNPLLLKAQSRQLLIGLQQSHRTTDSTITAL